MGLSVEQQHSTCFIQTYNMESPLLENGDEETDNTSELCSVPGNSATQRDEEPELLPEVSINNETTWQCCNSPAFLICISHALSAWGDRMWAFAISIFLIGLTPVSFRLVAIHGMSVSLAVVAFGPLVGDWIDVTPRLKAARLTLIIQNVAVVACAGVLLIMMLSNTSLFYFLAFLLISFAIIARLASVGTTIAIERDWVVVIAKEDATLMAGTNANLRRIDLTCNILAPIITGIILYAGSTVIGIIFVAAWNVLSLFAEYYILTAVYAACPALAIKPVDQRRHGDQEDFSSLDLDENLDGSILVPRVKTARSFRSTILFLVGKVKIRIRTLRFGFKLYFQQRVALAGLGLASLYLTVLGFDSITTAYAYSQHLSPAILGGLTAAGALTGIVGTFIFPEFRKLYGLVRTGIISMTVQLFFLMFCVASVWAPGHPGHLLDPLHHHHQATTSTHTTVLATTNMVYKTIESAYYHTSTRLAPSINYAILKPARSVVGKTQTNFSKSLHYQNRSHSLLIKSSVDINPTSATCIPASLSSYRTENTNNTYRNSTDNGPYSFISLGLLMGGIVMSRIGLWMTDLAITQLFQENIAEKERGIVGGVQNSFNNVMDVVHFILVTVAPKPSQFGALVLVSVCMVGLGFACYVRFAWKFRKRLSQLEKLSQWSNSMESLEGSSSRLRKDNQSNSQEDMMTGKLSVENENYSL